MESWASCNFVYFISQSSKFVTDSGMGICNSFKSYIPVLIPHSKSILYFHLGFLGKKMYMHTMNSAYHGYSSTVKLIAGLRCSPSVRKETCQKTNSANEKDTVSHRIKKLNHNQSISCCQACWSKRAMQLQAWEERAGAVLWEAMSHGQTTPGRHTDPLQVG